MLDFGAASANGPKPTNPASKSPVSNPWALILVNVPFSPARAMPRYRSVFSIDNIDEALTPAGGRALGRDRGKNGASDRPLCRNRPSDGRFGGAGTSRAPGGLS